MTSKLNLNSIMIGTSSVETLASFYEKVFARKADMIEGGFYGWFMGGAMLSVGDHSEVKGEAKEPARIMFNFETVKVKEEFERIKKVGAKVVQKPYEISGAWIATFADPDGNYFQLMTPWE